MPGPPQKISILLAGGVDNRSETEFVQPIAAQGTQVKLRASTNTRLSVRPGGVVRSPAFTTVTHPVIATTAGERRYCLVSAAEGRTSIALRDPVGSSGGVIYGDAGRAAYGSSTINSKLGFAPELQATMASVVDAGSLGSRKIFSNIAMAYDATTGLVWSAYFVIESTSPFRGWIVVSAATADGVRVCGPQEYGSTGIVYDLSSSYPAWIGLTAHGADGVRVWWADKTAVAVKYAKISVSASSVLVSGATVTATAIPAAGILYGIDVCSDGGQYAYLVCSNSATPANATVRRIDVLTGSTTHSASLAGALNGGGQVSVATETIGGTRYVLVSAGSVTSDLTTMAAYGSTLTALWASVTALEQGGQTCGFLAYSGLAVPRAVYAISPVSGSMAVGPAINGAGALRCRVKTFTVNLSTGAIDNGATGYDERACMSLQTHMAQWWPDASTTIPVWALGATYGATGTTEVGGTDYVDDPCLVLHILGNTPPFSGGNGLLQSVAPVARLGVTRGNQAPARLQQEPRLASKSVVFVSANRAVVSYRQLADTSGASLGANTDTGSAGRCATLDFSPTSRSVAHDKDGPALIAAALPMEWDGSEIFEMGTPLQTPHMGFDGSIAGPVVLPAGAYSWRAINTWRDNAGLLHRSRPSKIISATSNGAALTSYLLTTAKIPTLSVARVSTLIYATETGGKTLHLAYVTAPLSAATQHTPPVGVSSAPMLYTTEATGAEFAPQPPPPAWDISIIGSRAWVLDAEVRERWAFSKLRIAGVGYEFHPALEVIIPSSAGKGYACREWQGLPVFLCEKGVYQTAGDGPANNGQGSPYAPPVKVSDYGCTNTASVATFPGGIIWQFGERFVTLNENGVRLVPDFACTHDVSCAVVATRYSEVLFFSATTAEVRVYNYEVGRWTTWDSETLPDPVTLASLLPYDPDTVLVYSQTTGITRRLDVDSISAAAHMTIETDWCLLGGDFQDHVELRDLVFSAVVNGPHGIEIDVYTDYEDTTPTTRVIYTEAKIDELADATGRYTLRVDPVQPNCRAMRIRVRDVVAAGVNTQGMGPRSLTVCYQLNGQLFEDAFLQGSHEGTAP